MAIRVKQGKGNKDRYVPLSPRLLDELRISYWRIGQINQFALAGFRTAQRAVITGNLSRHGIAAIYGPRGPIRPMHSINNVKVASIRRFGTAMLPPIMLERRRRPAHHPIICE